MDRHNDPELSTQFKIWRKDILKKTLDKSPEKKDQFTSISGHPIKRLYTPLDLQGKSYINDVGFPGQFPHTRGIHPTGYRGRLWTMRQFSGFGTPEETNQRYRYLLGQGQTGLSVAFHLPTIMGRDSDHPSSKGEVGKCGVAVDTLKDMEIIFKDIPLNRISTSMTINAPAAVLLAMYIAVAEKQGVNQSEVMGTIQNDILKEYMAQKTYIYPPRESVRIITDTIAYCTKYVPKWNTISISGYHIREAGSTATQELAFTLANGFCYVEEAIKAGLNVDDFAPRLSFFFNSHNDFFEEIAKFRAARRIWAKGMKERYNAKKPRSCWMRFHTQTAGCSLTAQQPENNIVRVTIQALAAILGGTQSLHTNSMDEAWALPAEKAVTIALRTQQILAHEAEIVNTVDPLAGSYYLETLTNEMEEEANRYFDQIEKLGGVISAIEKGFFQREIAKAAFKYQREIERKERIIVGVNDYKSGEEVEIPVLKIPAEVERQQVARLNRTRRERTQSKVKNSLNEIQKAAKTGSNLMPPILDAVKSYATIGEICDVLREVFGEYKEPPIY